MVLVNYHQMNAVNYCTAYHRFAKHVQARRRPCWLAMHCSCCAAVALRQAAIDWCLAATPNILLVCEVLLHPLLFRVPAALQDSRPQPEQWPARDQEQLGGALSQLNATLLQCLGEVQGHNLGAWGAGLGQAVCLLGQEKARGKPHRLAPCLQASHGFSSTFGRPAIRAFCRPHAVGHQQDVQGAAGGGGPAAGRAAGGRAERLCPGQACILYGSGCHRSCGLQMQLPLPL